VIEASFGRVLELIGPDRERSRITFTPARIELSGSMFTPRHPLVEWLKATQRELLSELGTFDAVWVRGRITHLFGVHSLDADDRPEKSFSFFSFVAVVDDGTKQIAVPFECSDSYGRSALTFSEEPESPPPGLMALISAAFWELLLDAPEDVADFADTTFHPGACIDIRFGIVEGVSFVHEDG
jgi:hypothetical protein